MKQKEWLVVYTLIPILQFPFAVLVVNKNKSKAKTNLIPVATVKINRRGGDFAQK